MANGEDEEIGEFQGSTTPTADEALSSLINVINSGGFDDGDKTATEKELERQEQAGAKSGLQPLGDFHPDFAPRQSTRGGLVEGAFPPAGRQPLYTSDSIGRHLGNMDPVTLAQTQQMMMEAGLLDEARIGFIDKSTKDAMDNIMTFANENGMRWRQALSFMVANPEVNVGEGGGRGKVQVSLMPDYATLQQKIKGMVRRELGREPEPWEMEKLGSDFTDMHRQRIGNEIKTQQQLLKSGEETPEGELGVVEATEVDPDARFAELFDEKYKPEIETEQREEDIDTNLSLLMGSLTGMDRAVGA